MKRFFGLVLALVAIFSVMGQTRKGGTASKNVPDFAYPDKVEQTAIRDLDAALKRADGPATVNALIRVGLAKAAVSSDSLPVVLARIGQVEAQCGDVAVKSLLDLLQARIYMEIYSGQAYKINRRATVASMAGEDYNQWSKQQFLDRVRSLVSAALKNREMLLQLPLESYKDVVTYDRSSLTFYPTLYDFMAYQAIDYLMAFDGYSVLNRRLMLSPMDNGLYPMQTPGSVSGDVLGIYRSIAEGRGDSAPAILARSNQLSYILPRMFDAGGEKPSWAGNDEEASHTQAYEAYMQAYKECASSPYAVELLLALDAGSLTATEKTALFSLLERYIADNPSYFNINEVKNLRNQLARKDVSLTIPTQGAKGEPVTVVVRSQNVNRLKLHLYNVTKGVGDRRDSYYRMPEPRPAPVATVDVELDGDVPFTVEREVSIVLPDYGYYVIAPAYQGQQQASRSYPLVSCSNLSAGVYSGVGASKAVAVDVMSGSPCKGVSMYFRPWSRAQANGMLPGVTDDAGLLAITKSNPGTIEPRLGNDRYSPVCNYYSVSDNRAERDLSGDIFTALNLYHLGDKVDFSIVAYETGSGGNHIAPGRSLCVGLRDANFQEIDTLRVMTDEWGRAEGSFTLPSDGLTGDFTLTLCDDGGQLASRRIMVSDYKLPTFEVKVTDVQRPAKPGDNARISGEALTFAGFPVDGAQVKVQLSVRTGFWYWASVSPVFYEAEASTDSTGNFTVVIPAAVIAASPAPEGYFIANVAVTAPDGETRAASSGFNMGKPMSISTNIPQIYCADGSGVPEVVVRDYNGDAQQIELSYAITAIDTPLYGGASAYREVQGGTCLPGSVGALLSTLPSGKYGIRFAPVDTALTEEAFHEFVLYRTTDTGCPVNELLWLPEQQLVADDNGEVEIPYASAVATPHIFLVVCDSDGRIAETRWLTPSAGMARVKVKLPSADKPARAYFRIVSRMQSASASVDLKPASSQRAISISVETFRDKVTPGNLETLKFKVKGVYGASPESAVILDMSNKAIDVLRPNPLNLVPASFWGRWLNLDGLHFGSNRVSLAGEYRHLSAATVVKPEWEQYGQRFFPTRTYFAMSAAAGGVKMRGSNVKASAKEDAVDIVTVEECCEVMADMDSGAQLNEMVTVSSETQTASENNDDNGVYRPSELPLAFFRPMLQTDGEGNLEVTYTVPDANTTWVLRSLAFNRNLLVASNKVEIVASKPLMVSSNAPRYLRTGDKVRLLASVMNATDTVMVATSVCEILDFSTGKVVATSQSTDSIEGMGRKVVGIELEASAGVQGLIFRVKSSAGDYTDGEQTLIPVLASAQDVVETEMFYLAPGQNHFMMPVDAVTDGRAYLKFTENPAWEVVSALPGLRESQINSSLEAAAAIFSVAVADGLMKDYPEIAHTLRKWRDNPADSALVSQLEKNSELKTILLNSTPWVSDALSQTERMQRLVLLLDSRNTSRVIEKGIADLSKMVTPSGGWSWTPNYTEPSEWCTGNILDMLGDLNRLGWLPADKRLTKMIENAVAYTDRNVAKEFAQYPKSDYTLYCYTRGKFKSLKQSTAAAKVTKTMVQRIISGWKDHSVVVKACDAVILNDNGYNATARQILESLRQYATETPEKGMWWQQLENTWFNSMNKVGCTSLILDAFALTDPGNAAIDKIRQWLILEKQNTDWGNAVVTSQVISSILTSGRKWTVNPAGTAIRVGDTLIEPVREEAATGAFTEQITHLLHEPTTLTVDRQGDYPSFGAIVAMRHAAMDALKAVGCAELSVEKRMSVFNGTEWIPSDSFKVGDRVKVSLVLKADADMDYVVIQDARAAALEPVEQLPTPLWSEGLCFYRENRDAQTNIFINRMPRGTYVLDYELFATQGGTFASGAAMVQSQYNPAIAAHSAGTMINVE